jgi:hypothetical protein
MALDKSGAARLLAEGVVNLLGPVRMQCCSDYWRLLLWRPVLFHPGECKGLNERFGSIVRKLLLDQLRSQNSDKTIFHYPKTDKKGQTL